MNYKKNKFTPLLIISLILISICSCSTDDNNDDSEVMLLSTSCVAKDIIIDGNSNVTYPIESFWQLNTVLTIKCQGKSVENTEVSVTLWPPFGEYKIVTDKFGKAQIIENGQGVAPIGKIITVTLLTNESIIKKEFMIN